MKLLSSVEAAKQKEAEQNKWRIKQIVYAYNMGMMDFVDKRGYSNVFCGDENIAYDIGWNKIAAAFPLK